MMRSHTRSILKLTAVPSFFNSNPNLKVTSRQPVGNTLIKAYVFFRYFIHLNLTYKPIQLCEKDKACFQAHFIHLSKLFYELKHKEFIAEVDKLKLEFAQKPAMPSRMKRLLIKAMNKEKKYGYNKLIAVKTAKDASRILRTYANCDEVNLFQQTIRLLSPKLLNVIKKELPQMLNQAYLSRSLRVANHILQNFLVQDSSDLDHDILCMLHDILSPVITSPEIEAAKVRNYCYVLSACGVRLPRNYERVTLLAIDRERTNGKGWQAMIDLKLVFLETWKELDKQEGVMQPQTRFK